MARILLIDDDRALLDVLSMAMEDEGHRCLVASDGREGLTLIGREQPDVVVSDVNMPRLDGFALCKELRAQGNHVPLVLLTSRDSEIDEALGLDLGADDYVTKPFSTRVLTSRIAALLRRTVAQGAKSASPVLVRVGRLSFDTERLQLSLDDTLLRTTVTEFRVLLTLAERPGIVLSRERIMERVRGDDSVVAPRIIDTYVRSLRRKLESVDESYDMIETVVGAGYRLRAQP
jgi:DNA-binding response OmpR family regulator